MADNYLENKMEEHRKQSSSRTAPRHSVSSRTSSATAPRPGRLVIDFPVGMCVFIWSDEFTPLLEATVKQFRAIDAKVDFCCSDRRKGTSLAQQSGARYLPLPLAQALQQSQLYRGKLDATIDLTTVDIDATNPAGAAILLVLRCHPTLNI